MKLCDYGCGKEAKFIFKNGKKCCSKNHRQCPNKTKANHDYKSDNAHNLVNCKYCEKQYFYSNLKQHEHACKLNPSNIKYCLNCNKILSRRQKKYCSSKCFANHTNTTQGYKHTKETKKKISDGVKKVSPTRPDMLRREYVIIDIVCPVCGFIEKFETTAPNSYNRIKTCSKKCLSKYLSIKSIEAGCGGYRKGSGKSKNGYYNGIYCGSSYELIFLAYHLDIGSNIKSCDLKIPYMYENKQHNYHPDFEIDGVIYEMKGYYTETVDIKTKAAINNGYEIKVLYFEELEPMLKHIKEKFNFKNVIELYE